jgi:phosphoenolpyruvate-protein kinase (PTS system EI component)
MMDRRPDVLSSQLRALLMAAGQTDADLRIMLPLVSQVEEIEQARVLLEEARTTLMAQGVPLPGRLQFGMMVETPAAALLAHHFAQMVDFFSIGTNDLTQYTLAVDRTNERVAHLASPYHPAVLRLIAMTIEAAHARGKWVGLCGEFAGDVQAVPLLLGLGLDEFSMAPVSIPAVKEEIRRWSLSRCREIAQTALELPTTQAVKRYLQEVSP